MHLFVRLYHFREKRQHFFINNFVVIFVLLLGKYYGQVFWQQNVWRKKMTCKEFSGMVPAFMNDTLDNADLRDFLAHHASCPGCREELEIQYLVDKAFNQMEIGEEINLSRDLPAYLEKESRRLHRRLVLRNIAAVLEGITVTAAVLTAIIYLM